MSQESGGQKSESRTYAVSKTLRHTVDPSGKIQKVAAAVLVDDVVDVKEEKGQRKETRHKRTPEEMKQIEDAAKAAIGFDPARGDILSVQNISFLSPPWEKPIPPPVTERIRVVTERWIWLARYLVLLLLFFLIYLLILRPVKNQLVESFRKAAETRAAQPRLAGAAVNAATGAAPGSGAQEFAVAEGRQMTEAEIEQELNQTSSDVQRVVRLKRHLTDKVKREPIASTQLIRHWIHQGTEH
jgi:flagellar M-ring protein FliF